MKITSYVIIIAFIGAIYGAYGFKYNKDIFTQEKIFDEMAGIIPFIILITSLLLIVISIIIRLYTKKH